MFQNIIVPLDGSARAEQALSIAAQLARGSGGSLILLRVITATGAYGWYPYESSFDLPDLRAQQHAWAKTYLRDLTFSEALQDVKVETAIVDGEPASAILDASLSYHATMIVMCSHGDSGIRRWMLGSVSHKVARHSTLPVMVLRPDDQGMYAPFYSKSEAVRVLVPLDGSEQAEEALAPAVQLAQALSTPATGALHLACVLSFDDEDQDTVVKIVQEYLVGVEQRLREREAGKQLTLTSSIALHMDTAQALVELAEHGKGMEEIAGFTGCDLIAMTTHGRSAVARWMMGSITERVLDTTTLPIVIIRAHKTQAKPAEEHSTTEATGQVTKDEDAETPSWVGLL